MTGSSAAIHNVVVTLLKIRHRFHLLIKTSSNIWPIRRYSSSFQVALEYSDDTVEVLTKIENVRITVALHFLCIHRGNIDAEQHRLHIGAEVSAFTNFRQNNKGKFTTINK